MKNNLLEEIIKSIRGLFEEKQRIEPINYEEKEKNFEKNMTNILKAEIVNFDDITNFVIKKHVKIMNVYYAIFRVVQIVIEKNER